MKKISLILIFLLVSVIGVFAQNNNTLTLSPTSITVEPGASYLSISKILKENDIIKSDKVFYYYSRIKNTLKNPPLCVVIFYVKKINLDTKGGVEFNLIIKV